MNTGNDNNDEDSSNEQFATPRSPSSQPQDGSHAGGRVSGNVADREGRSRGRALRSNTNISGPIQDVGDIISRSRSRNRNRNRRPSSQSSDNDGEDEEEKKQAVPRSAANAPPVPSDNSSRQSSVHPERQSMVNQANDNANAQMRSMALDANSGVSSGPRRPPIPHNTPPNQPSVPNVPRNPNLANQQPIQQSIQSIIPQIQSINLNRNNQQSQPPAPSASARQSQLQSIMMGQLLESNRVLQQQLQALTNRMDQYQNDAASSASNIANIPGIRTKRNT